jgi:phage terminase large subunit
MGFSTSPENAGVNLQGFHGANVLVIIDEATGVEGPIWDAIEGARAGGDVRQLVLCNPVVPSGPVYEIFIKQRAQWHTITIDAFDTPNLKCACQQRHGDFTLDVLRSLPPGLSENGHPLFAHKPWPELVSRYWVYEMYRKYGEDSAFFESRVRGQFPTQAEDSLYSLAKLEAARSKAGEQLDDGVSPVVVGIDVAGPGKDETTVTVRRCPNIIAHKAWTERDAAKQQGAVVNFLERWRGRIQCINVDATGLGHYFSTALRGYVIQAINFGEEPKNRGNSWAVQCANRKAEMYWRTREVLDAGELRGLDEEMISQAAQVRFFYDLRGQVAIEPKKAAARRGVSSPDRWESVVLAFGVDAYESLAKSLAFAMRAPVPANGQIPPRDPWYEELGRERRMDSGQRYTNPSLFSHIGRGKCW